MITRQQIPIITTIIAIVFGTVFNCNAILARGFGGGYHGGGFNHSNFDRYGSDLSDMHGFYNHGYLRNDNWGNGQHALATDGGLGRAALVDTSSARGNRVTSAQLASRANAVRDAYQYPGVFDHGWWADHPGAWGYGVWGDDWAWGGTSWPMLADWWGMPVETAPTEYDYGNNITYQNDNVYYGTQPLETQAAYYTQAQVLAQSVPYTPLASLAQSAPSIPSALSMPAGKGESQSLNKNWKPLGVYSLVQGGQTNTSTMFQLAIDKKGAIKGNYYNALTGETQPVTGAVDKKSMRAAWTVGKNKNVVYDTGLYNLLSQESSVLVHLGKDKTQQWTLVKLQQQKESA